MSVSPLRTTSVQPVTVRVADATLPLCGLGLEGVRSPPSNEEPSKPLGTTNEAETWPPAVALAVVSTVALKLTSTGSEGPNPRQARMTRDPAGPVLEERALCLGRSAWRLPAP